MEDKLFTRSEKKEQQLVRAITIMWFTGDFDNSDNEEELTWIELNESICREILFDEMKENDL